MAGLAVNDMTREQVAAAVLAIPPDSDFVWDGVDEDDRPLSKEEMQAGIKAAAAKKPGRPPGTDNKEQVSVRFDRDVLAALRASGKGWQTLVNDIVRRELFGA